MDQQDKSAPKWTPGPWVYIDATQSASMKYAPVCVIKSGDKQIASFSWNDTSKWWPTKAESQANARLIAATPELYEALAKLADAADESDDACYGTLSTSFVRDIARAALAKATGSQQ